MATGAHRWQPSAVRTALCALLAATAAGSAAAADLFLKPEQYRSQPGDAGVATVLNGTIEKSRNALEWQRVAGAELLSGEQVTGLTEQQWSIDGDKARVAYESTTPGTQVLSLATEPRAVEFTPEQFKAYVALYGLDAGSMQATSGENVIRERYSKYARALIQVGDSLTDDHRRSAGHPVEVILDENPYALRFGNEVGFTVLSDGKPAAGVAARAGCEGFHGHDLTGNHISHYDLRTDDSGKARFLLSQKCVWYVSLVELAPSDAPGVDFESHWATVTFEVR